MPTGVSFRGFAGEASGCNVGRIFADQKALENVLREGNMLTFTAVDLGSMPFREQIKLVRSSNMLVKEDQ